MTGSHCFCLWYYWHSRQLYERVLVKCWPLNLSIFSHLLMLNVLNIVLFESILWGPLSQRSVFSRILGGFKSCVHKEAKSTLCFNVPLNKPKPEYFAKGSFLADHKFLQNHILKTHFYNEVNNILESFCLVSKIERTQHLLM